jgi:hypothetical protein
LFVTETSLNNSYFANHFHETTKGQDILDVFDSYFGSHDLSRKSCISICTDGDPSLLGGLKVFVTLAKQKNPGNVITHDFLHREPLISKSIVPEVQKVLDGTIKMVNYIKSRPLQSRLFPALCSAMEAAHSQHNNQ